MKKLLLMPFAFITLMAIMLSTAVGTTSCMSAHERDSIKRAERVAVLKNELTTGFKLNALQDLGDFDKGVIEVKGVCAPDKKVLYLALDSISYETNIISESEDGKWTNVLSFEPDSMVIIFAEDATITKIIEEPLSSIQGLVDAAYEADVVAATKAATDAAELKIKKENSMDGDGSAILGKVTPVDLQRGKFSYEKIYYYPGPRGGMERYPGRPGNITIKRDGEGFTVE